jgi:uncharacterized sporulation protein YeaH/YhbH (DUF444 family)
MSQVIDKRLNGKNKSAVNRQRFIKRYKEQLKKGVEKAITNRSITDIDKGEDITIPSKDISEPRFGMGQGGRVERVFPGNEKFVPGDTIARPPSGQGGGSGDGEASNEGEGEDDFVFELSREEFLDLYFEDLELPDLVRKELATIDSQKFIRAGFTSCGVPSNINVVRSMKQATGRRLALGSPYKKELREAKLALKKAKAQDDLIQVKELEEQIRHLKRKINRVPFIDTIDLRYNNRIKVPNPSTQAVMFCLMDVSGSMDEAKKDIAKRFFILLYLFLKRNYERIELVFIRHHTSAKEVDEEEFFYSRETGGTVVSSALELTDAVIRARYPQNAWNVYVAQASDGDNWNADSPYCQEILIEKIMPLVQYYSYVEIMPRHHQSLWEVYKGVADKFENFAMENIDNISDIYPVFRELFKRKAS